MLLIYSLIYKFVNDIIYGNGGIIPSPPPTLFVPTSRTCLKTLREKLHQPKKLFFKNLTHTPQNDKDLESNKV